MDVREGIVAIDITVNALLPSNGCNRNEEPA
jgi:hypothetical protein